MIFERVEKLKEILHNSCDLAVREIICGRKNINVIFLKSVIDEDYFISGILSPIMDYGNILKKSTSKKNVSLDILMQEILKAMDIEKVKTKQEIIDSISKNKLLLFIEDEEEAIAIDIIEYPVRMPTEPPTSAVMRGPREGFVEDIKKNIAMLRRRFVGDKLSIDQVKIGKYSQTEVALVYIDEIADDNLIKQVKKKLKKIDIDGIVDSYYLVSFLQEKKGAMFKQVGNSEKPDIVSSKILEGRVAIIVNNSPIVLTIPFLYLEDLQNSNDYYSLSYYSSYIRVIRLIGILIAIIAPGIYLSLRLYHYNVMPLNFLMTIGNSSETIPFTPFLEIMFILILFEILYEVSLRLPRYFGLATSIVGALILGETGVKAGLISSPGVMIIALSVIAVYTIPDQVEQLVLLRFIFLILGAGLGIFGILGGVVFIVAYLNTMDSYGAPYLAPFSPLVKEDLKDTICRAKTSKMFTRPKSFKNKNNTRLNYGKED